MEYPREPWKLGFVSPLWLPHSSTLQKTEKVLVCFLQKTSQTPEREQLQECREVATVGGGRMSWPLRCQKLNSWLIFEELFPLLNITAWDKTVSRGSDCYMVLLGTKYTKFSSSFVSATVSLVYMLCCPCQMCSATALQDSYECRPTQNYKLTWNPMRFYFCCYLTQLCDFQTNFLDENSMLHG